MEEHFTGSVEYCVQGFEKLIADMSSDLINVKYAEIDNCIQRSIEKLARYVGADRSYIFLFSEDKSRMTNTYEWCCDGVVPFISELQDISIDTLPWFRDKILARQTLEVFDVDELEDSLPVKHDWQRQSIKSIICVPMICNELFVGFIGFDAVKSTRRWSTDTVDLLKLSGGIFASAIVRQNTEHKLHESERMMRIVLDTIPSRLFWKDAHSVYRGCNKSFAADAGIDTPEKIAGKTDYDLAWTPEQADFYRECDRRIMANDIAEFDITCPQRRGDGQNASIKTNKIPIHDDDGSVVGIVGSYADITEGQKAKDELERAKACIDHAADAVFWVDKDGLFFDVNGTACRSLGYSRQELLNMSVCDIVLGASKESWSSKWKIIKKNRISISHESHMRKDGAVFPIEVLSTYFNYGDVEYIVAFVRDITERKRTEDAIKNLHLATSAKIGESCINALVERLGHILDADCLYVGEIKSKPSPMIKAKYVFMDGKIVDGFEHELAGCPCQEVVSKEVVCYPSGVIKKFPNSDIVNRMQIEGYIGIPLFNSNDESIGIQSVIFRKPIRDVEFVKMIFTLFAGRVKAELQRLQIEKERESLVHILKDKTEELKSIVYVSSHDLRTPLVSIQGFSGELEKGIKKLTEYIESAKMSDEDRSDMLSLIEDDLYLSLAFITKSATKMDILLQGLLKLSRIGKAAMEFEPLNMNQVITDVLDAMRYQIDESSVQVQIESLPDCYADKNQIDQLFSNLIDNAIKYLDPDRKGVVKISGTIKDDVIVYCVQDNGMGIENGYLKNIFNVFHRLDPDSKIKGEGLGLTIVKRIVAKHAGKVWAESELGVGSRFYISLPTA